MYTLDSQNLLTTAKLFEIDYKRLQSIVCNFLQFRNEEVFNIEMSELFKGNESFAKQRISSELRAAIDLLDVLSNVKKVTMVATKIIILND